MLLRKSSFRINAKGLQIVFVSLFLLMSFHYNAFAGLHDDDISVKNKILWEEGSTQVIYDDYTVHNGVTLIIESGVTVEVNNARIIVHGKIQAIGTKESKIIFTSNHEKHWQGFEFNGGDEGSVLEHCVIENARYDYDTQQVLDGLFRIRNTPNLSIKNSMIKNNTGGLFRIRGGSTTVLFEDNVFERNTVDDKEHTIGIINLVNHSSIIVRNCLFWNNTLNTGGVIRLENNATANIFNSRIRNNSFHPELAQEEFITSRMLIRVTESELNLSDSRLVSNDGIYLAYRTNSVGNLTNNCIFEGGGMSNEIETRALHITGNSELTISRAVFKHFSSSAIDSRISRLSVNESKFYHCASEGNAGAINIYNPFDTLSTNTDLSKNIFFSNYAENNGGAVYFDFAGTDTLAFHNNHFFANEAASGGAVAGQGGHVRLLANDFYFNNAVLREDAKENEYNQGCGGGVYLTNTSLELMENRLGKNAAEMHGAGAYIDACHGLIEYNIFDQNEADRLGGGLYLIHLPADALGFIENVIIRNTSGVKGAGMSVVDCGHLEIKRNLISYNKPVTGAGAHRGGGLHIDSTPVAVLNSIINGNQSSAYLDFDGHDGGGVFVENISENDTVYFLNSSIVGNLWEGVTGIHIDGKIIARNTLSYDNEYQWWIDRDNSNAVSLFYSAISPSDNWHNIGAIIQFENGLIDIDPKLLQNRFLIEQSSPLIDKGDPDPRYNDEHFVPNGPSYPMNRNDIGATGGPHAKKMDGQGLNIYEYNATEQGRPIANFSYEVVNIQGDYYTIKFTDASTLHGATRPNYYWFWGEGTDKFFYNYNPAQYPTLTVEKTYYKPQMLEVSLYVETKGGIDSHTKLVGSPATAGKPRALGNNPVIFNDEDTVWEEYETDLIYPGKEFEYEWEIDAHDDLIADLEIINGKHIRILWNRPPEDVVEKAEIMVRATNHPFEPGPWSQPLIVTIPHDEHLVSLESIHHEGFSIFPNPTDGLLHVHFDQMTGQDYRLIIMDHAGRKTLENNVSKGVKELSLDISAYPPGLYIVIIESAGIRQSFKLVKK